MSATARPGLARWNVTAVNDPDAFDRYRAGLADWYDASGFSDADIPRFFTEKTICQFGDFVLARGRSIGQTLTRGPEQIRRSGLDGVTLLLDFGGLEGDADGLTVSGRPGTVHIRHQARPSAARLATVDVITITMPREAAPSWLMEPHLHGASIDSGPAIGRILINHISALASTAPTMGLEQGINSIRAALILAEKAFRNSGRLSSNQTKAVYRSIRAAATQHIDRHLTEPQLGIVHLTNAIGVSRATLFRAFSESGGINRHITHQRLQRARSALLERIGRNPSVAEIAHTHGFVSEAHFSRLFKLAYGTPPGAVRPLRTLPEPDFSGDIRYDLLLDWMKGGPD